AVIVVEAALQSGSLITARYAAEQNRDVFVVPGSPMDPRYRGSNALIRNGATLITKSQDVLDVLNEPYRQIMKEATFEEEQATEQDNYLEELPEHDSKTAEDLSKKIMDQLSSAPIFLDELIRECSYSSSIVLSALLELELAGKITRHPGNKIST
ncbi:MAG TPA: DNA-protecting protein DprA, partial [Holosporales bacterium]|nr:DNA-protecting protein DprA [Holosporales bacterium]